MKHLFVSAILMLSAAHLCGCGGGRITKQWRLGIYQGGDYHDYPLHLIGFVRGLESLGCLPTGYSEEISTAESLGSMWSILSSNLSAQSVQFVNDAFWSADWNDSLRSIIVETIAERTGPDGDIDMMIAMGTWAGQDLAGALSRCPVIVLSASDPVAAGICSLQSRQIQTQIDDLSQDSSIPRSRPGL